VQERGSLDRFAAVGVVTRRERAPAILGPGVGADGNRRNPLARLPHPRDELVAVDVRHRDVCDQQVDGWILDGCIGRHAVPQRFHGQQGRVGRIALDDPRATPEQERGKQVARIPLIVHDEDDGAIEPDLNRLLVSHPRAGHTVPGADSRQPHLHRRPAIEPFALGVNVAAMLLDEMAGERQAQAQPAVPPGRATVTLPEPIEDVGQKLGRDTRTGVTNLDENTLVRRLADHRDQTSLGSELDRIRQNFPMTRPRLTSGMKAIAAIPSASIVGRYGSNDGSRRTSGTTIGCAPGVSGVQGVWPSTALR
jgi:hypothetical protein